MQVIKDDPRAAFRTSPPPIWVTVSAVATARQLQPTVPMALAFLVISMFAFVAAVTVAVLQLRTARQSNALPVLVDLFAGHPSDRLAEGRTFVRKELRNHDLTHGLAGIAQPQREQVRDLAWCDDNLGTLVAHGHIDVEPVSGYLGGRDRSLTRGSAAKVAVGGAGAQHLHRSDNRVPGT